MPYVRTLAPAQFPLLAIALIVTAGFATLTTWPKRPSPASFDPRCESWDDAAGAMLAFMIQERDEMTEAMLGDALFRLRRARKYCRYGFIKLARLDYDALQGPRYAMRRKASLTPPRIDEATNGNAVKN